jgi:hypothetical protein
MRSYLIVVILSAVLAPAAQADSMRCGKWVVNEEATAAEILDKCGQPQRKERREEDVYSRNPAGFTNKQGVKVVELWYYKRSTQALEMVVQVIDGKVTSIQRAES